MENRFYTNKYPISCCVQLENNQYESLPAGHVFTIDAISGDFIDLKPVNKIKGFTTASVSIAMFKFAFIGSEYGETNGQD